MRNQPCASFFRTHADPDVEQQFMPSIAHWVVINIPENHVDLGNTIVEYVGSFPRRGTGECSVQLYFTQYIAHYNT